MTILPVYNPPNRLGCSQWSRSFATQALALKTKIYCSRDPVNQLVCNVQADGEQFPWHFDGNEYIVTLTLREAERGGELWTCPEMRRPGDENVEVLGRFLKESEKLFENAGDG